MAGSDQKGAPDEVHYDLTVAACVAAKDASSSARQLLSDVRVKLLEAEVDRQKKMGAKKGSTNRHC